MSSYDDSADFEQDFRDALEDLQLNNRFDIQNLTMIARENTEHALAISQVLQEHIKRTAAHKKLPALYVMDSIVKNVGTPYTLFFGKHLYQTFMNAYASVDQQTRRKMDEMLKTWKEPIPGSIDTRPVFSPEVTRPIETALIKARTSAMQAQQQHMRAEQQLLGRNRATSQTAAPYRHTPTPPNGRPVSQGGYYPPPYSNGAAAPYGHTGPPPMAPTPELQGYRPPSRSTPQPASVVPAYPPSSFQGAYGTPQPGISVDALREDIHQLISAGQAEFARTPHDASIQTRLRALQDLQGILQIQSLPQEQLVTIKNRIAELAVTMRAPAPAQTPTPVPIMAQQAAPAVAPSTVSIDSLLGSGALAALLARAPATPQMATPQQVPAPLPVVAIRSPQPPQPASSAPPAAAPSTNPASLMEMLRKAGMLPAATPTNSSQPSAIPPPPHHPPPPPVLPPSLSSFPLPLPTLGPPTLDNFTRDITLKASSLKQWRPHLLPFMFDALGSQCSQCGRRFAPDDEGKKKKTAHMDWHFKVNQRIAETEKRGQHRSWFVDEMDWINSREVLDEDRPSHDTGDGIGADGSSSSGAKKQKLQYLPVPDDPILANSVCPICQEKFETRWLDDAQEFVWPDAVRIGDRIYHASCHREATTGGGGAAAVAAAMYSRATPEPVLGKRKAEEEMTGLRNKLKTEL